MEAIDAKELTERLQNGEELNLLDVREELEYLTFNIGGKNLPVSRLLTALNELSYNKNDEVIVICTVGKRSETACNLLTENGYKNVRNLAGGLIALQKIKHNID
jgi:adenylyltransferase/sulfurtransferase